MAYKRQKLVCRISGGQKPDSNQLWASSERLSSYGPLWESSRDIPLAFPDLPQISYVTKDAFELLILLPEPLVRWDYSCVPPQLAQKHSFYKDADPNH